MRLRSAIQVLCTTLLTVLSAAAQVNTASLTGTIKDSSDAVLPNSKIAAVSKTTGIEHTTDADGAGYYLFASLPAGTYTVRATQAGFQPVAREITLDASQKGRLDFVLSPGAVQTQVNVEAVAPQLSPEDASLGSVVDNTYISQMPLLLRNWDDLMSLVAGVQGSRYTDQGGGTSFGRTGGFNVHGVRSLQNNFILDGIDNNSISENVQELTSQVVRPSVDTIQEFKIITNAYSAEYGRSPGAAINVITKGGTNQFHGTGYEYLRNRVFDANNFFNNRSNLPKPQNVQNQFGTNLGGPIVKDKLFFFFDYEGTRIRQGVSRITTTPLANERIGDFSPAAAAAAHVTYPTIYDPTTGQPFQNNTIPSIRIDPVAAKLMALFPNPTAPGLELNNFARNAGLSDDTDRYNGRVDWQAGAKDSIFARYTFSTRGRFIPGNFGGIADGTSSSSFGRQALTAHGVASGWTHTLSPRLVNELRLGYLRDNSFAAQDPFGQNLASDYVPGVPVNPAIDGGVPQISFANFNTFLGSPDFLPKFQVTQQFQWTDTVSYLVGRHSLKFGADVRAPLRNTFMDIPATRGHLTFDKIFTCQRNAANQCVANTGLSYADFLLGYVQGAQLTNVDFVDQRLHMISFFAQDDFKISSRLTMNLGLRYDFATPALEGKNHIANFNPAGPGSLVFGQNGSLEQRALVQPNTYNFAPRLGLAYQLTPKTVLRAGYGIFYALLDRIGSEDQLSLNPPSLINNNISLPATATAPVFILKNGFPTSFLDPTQLDLRRVRIRAGNPDDPNTYVQQWSGGFQRTLPWNFFVEADYVGTKSTHLNTLRNLNQPINGVVPYPNFGQIEYRDPLGNGIYHGLDFTLERRFSAGLQIRMAYTWSKSIDDTAEHLAVYGSNSFSQNGRDFSTWRGPSDYDVPQHIALSYVYQFPFGKGKRFLTGGPLAYVIGGWEMSGVLTLASGRPFTVFATANNSSIDNGLQNALPNVVGTPTLPQSVDCWYYASRNKACAGFTGVDAFVTPPPGVFGNEGRNVLRAPGTGVFDFALQKEFALREALRLSFRAEAFNLANSTQFGLPDRNITGGTPGAITTLASDPRIMQFALRLRF